MIIDYDPNEPVPGPQPFGSGLQSVQRESAEEAQSSGGWGAAFRTENPVFAAYDLMSRPQYKSEAFDFDAKLKEVDLPLDLIDPLSDALNEQHFDDIVMRIKQEQADRAALASAGWSGVGMQMAAGLLTPTILLPGGALAQGAGALRQGVSVAAWAALGVAIDEAVLQTQQETRTTGESLMAVGTGAILGGALGSGAAALSRTQIKKFESDMAGGENAEAIQSYNPPETLPQPAGAQITDRDFLDLPETSRLAGTFGLDRATTFISPVMRNIQQPYSNSLRWIQAQLSTGGMYLDQNAVGRASSDGGSIEGLTKGHYGKLYQARTADRGIFNEYRKATRGQPDRINRKDFDIEIGKALERGGKSDNPFVEKAAQAYREEVFLPLYQEAKQIGMPWATGVSFESAMEYMPRMLHKGLARQDQQQLRDIFTEHFEELRAAEFTRSFNATETRVQREEDTAELLGLDRTQVEGVRADLETEMATLPQQFGGVVQDVAQEIRDLRAQAKVKGVPRETAKAMRDQAKALEEMHKDTLTDFRGAENRLKSKFRVLDYTRAGLEDAQAKALGRVDKIEAEQLNTMMRALKNGQKLLNEIDDLEAGTKFEAAKTQIQGQLERAFGVFVRGEATLDKVRQVPTKLAPHITVEGDVSMAAKIFEDGKTLTKAEEYARRRKAIEDRQAIRAEALDEYYAKLDDLDNADVDLAKEILGDALEDLAKAAQKVNDKRAVRAQKLREQAESIDPGRAAEQADALRNSARQRRTEFMGRASQRGTKIFGKADPSGERYVLDGEFGPKSGVDFRDQAKADANRLYDTMVGEGGRIPAMHVGMERGPELARTLSIDPKRQWSNGRTYEDFLERDIEKVSRAYVRTMAPDIELYRRFRTVNPLSEESDLMRAMNEDFIAAREAIQKDPKLSEKGKQEALARLDRTNKQGLKDLNAQIARLRFQRGVPDDPEAISYRMGRVALNLNTLRLMGGVVVSSIPDMARTTMNAGFVNTFKNGLLPLVSDFKNFKAVAEEVRYAGVALDVALHGRSGAMFDILDSVEHGTMAERALQWQTNQFGKWAGFDYWNTGMKQFAGVVGNARLMQALQKAMEGKPSKADLAFLGRAGIGTETPPGGGRNMAERIWGEVTSGKGGDQVNGAWLPNTKSWGDGDAVRAYRAALADYVDSTIVTPGLERPLWMDGNMLGRIVGQFRTFSMSSTQKIMLAAAQDVRLGNVAPVLVGANMSLALGAFFVLYLGHGEGWRRSRYHAKRL